MLIFLIGMPGSGKTTLGKELAQVLHIPFIDLDHEIGEREKRSIEAIFRESGEEEFRKAEREVVLWAAGLQDAVVSTGGGAPCFFDNMEVMGKTGFTIYLDVPVEVLADRIRNSGENRPMAKGKSKEELMKFLKEKTEERSAFYKRASIIISGSDIKLPEILESLRQRQIIS